MVRGPGRRRWRCFHCDELFTTAEFARAHFGGALDALAACQIKAEDGGLVAALREAEATLARYRAEDGDVARAVASATAGHSEALREAEESGYARGLRDAKGADCPIDACSAIEFAIRIDDHFDRLEFLRAWQHREWRRLSEFMADKGVFA